MNNLIITGGTVVDGTGRPGAPLDIRVRNGRIVEMGSGLRADGETPIDASGAVVTPGFIDSHTHYDAAIYWDPMCDPMPQHGVTTVVIGNCALGLAPIRPEDRSAQIDVFSYIEDIPRELLNGAIPWNWETYRDYVEALAAQRLGVNLVTFVGHSQIRGYVMGEKAWTSVATAAEVAAMAAELDRALSAGARGLSFSLFDRDRQGRRVPSCLADEAEISAMCQVLAAHKAPFQFVPRGDTTEALLEDLERVGRIIGAHGVVGMYNIVVHVDNEPSRSDRVIECLNALHDKGVRLYAMASPRPFEMSIGFDQSLCFISVPAWNELVQAQPVEKRRLVSDQAWRSRAREDADHNASILFPFLYPEELRIGGVGSSHLTSWSGRTLRDLVESRGGHVSDVLADWLIENDFNTNFVYAIANTEPQDVVELLKSPVTFVSGSDGGAHLQMFCAAGDGTLLLTRYVRERGDMSLEEAVYALTGHQAQILGLSDRGVLAPGMAADITIFALEELDYGPEMLVSDVPGGRSRLTRRPGGYRYTIANGVVVQKQGAATGALPARWLKSAA
jgi:N-acyl-D-amino-acid deacylase